MMASPSVTPAEQAEYFRFAFGEIQAHFARKPPSPLWHYTTGQTLIEIIRSGEVWFTQIGCLNDAMELRHAIKLLRDALQARRKTHTPTPDEDLLYSMADAALAQDAAPSNEWFVFCLSEKADDLSQWRA